MASSPKSIVNRIVAFVLIELWILTPPLQALALVPTRAQPDSPPPIAPAPASPSGAVPAVAKAAKPRAPAPRAPRPPLLPGPVLPAALERVTPAAGGTDPWVLFDGRAGTAVVATSSEPIRWGVRFDGLRRLDEIAVHGGADGVLRAFVVVDGEQRPVEGWSDLDLSELPERWVRFAASEPVHAERLGLEWTPRGPRGLRELSFWGDSAAAASSSEPALADRILNGTVAGAVVANASPRQAEITRLGGTRRFELPLGDERLGFARAFLVYDLRGLGHFTAPARRINDGAVRGAGGGAPNEGGLQVEEISTRWLRSGSNVIEFLPAAVRETPGYRVQDLRIVGVPAGSTLLGRDPSRSLDESGAAGSRRFEVDFEEVSEPHDVVFELLRPTRGHLVAGKRGPHAFRQLIDLDGLPTGTHRFELDPALGQSNGLAFLLSSRAAESGAGSASIGGLVVSASAVPDPGLRRLAVTFPRHGECSDGVTLVRGFVDGPDAGAALLEVEGLDAKPSLGADGSFDLLVAEPPGASGQTFQARVTARFLDGETLRSTVEIGPCVKTPTASAAAGAVVPDLGAPFGAVVRPSEGGTLSFGGATLEIPPGALAETTRITIRPLERDQVRPLNRGMQNAVPGARGFRLGPHGLKFEKPVKLRLPYDPGRVPEGLSSRDLRGFYFDEERAKWVEVGRFGEASSGGLTSLSDHFTDFVNATLPTPDQPAAQSFNPNELKGMELGSPSAGVDFVDPPEGNASGSAQLAHPVETPPGRNGVGPELGFAYSSEAQNGWLGVGWDLSLSAIEVDTRFGVPRYTGEEAYLLDGEMLTRIGAGPLYRRRVEGQFHRIERLGAGPAGYSFVATDKNGTRFFYGSTAGSRLADPSSVPALAGRTFRWQLDRVEDLFGNVMTVSYVADRGNNGEPFVQLYPLRVDYTSHAPSGLAAAYHVDFVLDQSVGQPALRPDVQISGRAGFQVLTRYRLARVDVRLGESEVIRSYALGYRTGDFSKTLLETIGLHGLGTRAGDGTVTAGGRLYEHRFDYFAADPALFSAPTVWGNAKTAGGDRPDDGLSRSKDSTAGGGGEVGVGIGPISFTVGGGGFAGDDDILLSLFDLDGDGLSELIDSEGRISRNPLRRPVGDHFEFLDILAPGSITHTNRSGWHVKAGISFSVLGAGVRYTRSSADDDRIVGDIDGDGRADLLDAGGGGVQARLNRGVLGFAPPSDPGAARSFGPIFQGSYPKGPQELVSQAGDTLHPLDALLRWNAPFAGTVTVSGALRKVRAGGDGVRAEIYHNDTLLWSHPIGGDDLSTCQPGPGDSCAGPGLTVGVGPGERIYTRLANKQDPSPSVPGTEVFDEVVWEPAITYARPASELALREPYGPPIFRFSQSEDHRLAGRPETPFVASASGDVTLEGALVKLSTSDQIRVEVVQLSSTGAHVRDIVPETTLGAGVDSLAMPAGLFDVDAGDSIHLRVRSDVPVDPARVLWEPIVRYQNYCRLNPDTASTVCGAVTCSTLADGTVGCHIQNDPTPSIALPLSVIAHQAQPFFPSFKWLPHTPTETVVVGGSSASVIASVQKVAVTPDPVVVVVQGVHRLHFKQTLAPGFVGALPIVLPALSVTPGEQLFFTVFSDGNPAGDVSAVATVNGAPVPFNVRYRDASFDATTPFDPNEPVDPLSGGFHRWFTGQWNGNLSFDESSIAFPQPVPINSTYFMVPLRQGLPETPEPLWLSTNSDGYIGAGRQKPSRVGKLGGLRSTIVGAGDIEDLRSSQTWNVEFDVQVGPVDAAYNTGATTTDLDFLDVNGDRLADSVTGNGVVFNTGAGFGAKEAIAFGFDDELRRVEHRSVRAGVGAERSLINQTDSQGRSKSLLSTGFNVGIDYGYSAAHTELADVNGDGLPDHVRKRPSDGALLVKLNLGYRFGGTIAWSSSSWGRDATVTGTGVDSFVDTVMGEIVTTFSDDVGPDVVRLQDTGGKSVGVSVGSGDIGGGGGYTYSVARTFVDLVDINGDGLLDQLMKMPDEPTTLRVKLNRGDHFGTEELLTIPSWQGISGFDPPSYTFSGSADSLGFRRSQTFTGSVSAKVCFVVCVGGSGFYSEGNGWSQLEFDDIDGDGKLDHVLKLDGDERVYAKLNQIGKSNLLRGVTRPLGGSFELDYRRAGNLVDPPSSGPAPIVDMPSNQWVLAGVTVQDGRGNAYSQTYLYGDDDRSVGGESDPTDREEGFYSRTEREPFGYGTVITVREDLSRVTARHHNQDYYRKRLLSESVEEDAAGNLFTRQAVVYRDPGTAALAPGESTTPFVGTFFPAEVSRETLIYEGVTTNPLDPGKRTTERRSYDLETGDLEGFTDDGDDGVQDDVVYSIQYHEEPALHVRRPSLVEGRASDGTLLRKRTATYYEGTGALKTVTNVVVGGVNPETGQPYQDDPATNGMSSFTYDAFGNLESATDPRGFLLTYAYDDLSQSYRTSISDSFGYTSTSTPNHLFGTVANVVDVNGHELDYFFDDFGRLTEVFGPTDTDEASIAFDYGLQPDDPAPPFPAWARTRHRDVQHPEDPIVAVTFSDGIDRVIQTKKDLEKDDGSGGPPVVGMSVSGAVTFDARGRIRLQGQPVFETVSPESHLDGSTATTLSDVALKHPTEMEYDILSRPVRVATPDDASPDPSVTLTEYGFGAVNGVATLTTTVTDPLGNVRITHRDVDESVVGMVEFNRLRNEQASTELVTSYEYNPLDELVAVEDALGNRTTAVYDTIGRMVTLVSPDSGRTEWRYDRSGNLGAKQTAALRAQNQLVRYEYDFNRLRRVDYPTSVDVVYAYGAPEDAGDASFNRAGRVVEETSEAGSKVYEYDRLGHVTRLASTFQRIRTPNQDPYQYTMGYEYDSFGRLLTLEFPGESREIVRYGYDRGGLVKSARGEITGTPPQHARDVLFTDYFKHVGYDEFEQRVRFVAGNDITTRYGYYEKTHRLETVQADHRDPRLVQRGLPARPFQRLHYEYDRVGNPLEVRNDAPFDDSMQPGVLVATTEQVFTYDDLYQLRTADGLYQDRSAWRHRYGLSFEYDEIGRILFKDQASFRDLPNPPDEWTPDHPDQVQTYRAAYTYAAPRPNAPTRIDETILNGQVRPRRLSYDDSGNQTGWIYHQNQRRTVEWTEDDRVREISEQGLRLTRALYDGDGNRAVHVGYHGQEETAYLGENLTVRNAVYPSKHVFAGKDLVASKLDPEWFPHPPTLYYHPDQLGSAQFASNDQQELTQHDEFFPTGEVWQTQTEGRYSNRRVTLFTGKELDPGANLYYFGSRWYDPRQSQWISPDPILAHYMQGRVFGGVYSPRQLGLYSYAWNNPARLRDQDGNFVNFLIGAAVGAGLDLAVQVALVAAGKQEKIDGWSILVSAGAGAAGVGIASAITKAKHLSTLGKVAAGVGGDTAVSVGSKAAKGEEITALGVAADVALGQAGGKVLGKAAKGKAEKGTQSKLLEQAAKRAERVAKPGRSHGSKRPGRQAARAKKAADARAEATGFLDNAEVRGGAVGSNTGSKIVDVATQDKNKKEEKRAGRRLTPEQKAAVVEFNRLYGPDTAPPQ